MYKIIGADQKQYGPVSADDLRQWITEGRANAQTIIQAEGQSDWRPLSSYPEFATVAQPVPSGTPLTTTPAGDAAALVNGPGIALMIVGIFCVLTALLSLASNVFGFGANAFAPGGGQPGMPPQLEKWVQMTSGGVGVALNIIGLGISGFIIFASTKMRRLESYGLVMTGTIISMVPCISPCCCVGLPIGIWVLVVLSKPEVKSAFH